MHDGMPYGRNQGQGQGHSREVDRQSPTGLIFVVIVYTGGARHMPGLQPSWSYRFLDKLAITNEHNLCNEDVYKIGLKAVCQIALKLFSFWGSASMFPVLGLSPTSSPLCALTLDSIGSSISLTLPLTSDDLPRAGSGVVRIDPLRFLAGCRTRRLNQVLLCQSYILACFILLLFIRAPFYVLLVFVAMCSVFWLFWLSYQYLPSDWLERLL